MPLKKRTRYEVELIAERLQIEGFQTMTKEQLINAIRSVRKTQLPDNYGQAAGTISEKTRRRLARVKKFLQQRQRGKKGIKYFAVVRVISMPIVKIGAVVLRPRLFVQKIAACKCTVRRVRRFKRGDNTVPPSRGEAQDITDMYEFTEDEEAGQRLFTDTNGQTTSEANVRADR